MTDLSALHREHGEMIRAFAITVVNRWTTWHEPTLVDDIIAETYITIVHNRLLETRKESIQKTLWTAVKWTMGRYLQHRQAKKRGGPGQRDGKTKPAPRAIKTPYIEDPTVTEEVKNGEARADLGVTGCDMPTGRYTLSRATGNFDDLILERLEYEHALASASMTDRRAAEMRVQGYSQASIGEMMGMSKKSVDRCHQRVRKVYKRLQHVQ